MKKVFALILLFVLFFSFGCTQKAEYKDPVAPIYTFENLKKAAAGNDLDFAWNCFSSEFKENKFKNSFDLFKKWAVESNEFEELVSAEYVSEIVVVQNEEMILNTSKGNIFFVKEEKAWKIDSLLEES